MEVPRQLEATRWMDFDFRVARVSFLDFQLARVTSIWRGAQIHLARVFFRRLYRWVVSCIDQLEIVINTAFQGLCTPNLK